MAISKPFASLIFFFFIFVDIATPQATSFTYMGFNGSSTTLLPHGSSTVETSGLLRLTNSSPNVVGRAFYTQPVRFLNSSATANVSSFTTTFVFAIPQPVSGDGGFGFTFAIVPSPNLEGAEAGQYLGLLSKANDGHQSNHVFAVEFDTVIGFGKDLAASMNHIGININSMMSVEREAVAYYGNETDSPIEEFFNLDSGEPIQAWIEYDGQSKRINVTVCPTKYGFKPQKPLISWSLDLSLTLKETMYVGFTASTGNKASSHYILGWSFSNDGTVADPLDLSKLPPPPKASTKKPPPYRPPIIALIAALSIVTAVLLSLLVFFVVHKKRSQAEDLEDWEKDCPHRYRYSDLRSATNGFNESEVIGMGGFGAVYKGILPSTGSRVAIKKITPNSMQGLREFAAEIESLGRLRHKNLVNLQGWCKHKNDLLLMYDYIPNGSLDKLLFNTKKAVLSWEQRFKILKGIASGLLYLHEEWEQVVIHRDVKSSNVLIDNEMGAKLSDFGLARLYDHGTVSYITNIVGTVGYLAPELARNGNASESSDVFAYGVLILEVVSGRRPTGAGNFFVVDWVMELYESGNIVDAVDPKLESNYREEEVKLVLLAGLLCCHHKAEDRPTMRQVVKYMSREDKVPVVDNWAMDSREEFSNNFLETVSFDTDTAMSSISGMSSNITNTSGNISH